MPGRGPWDADKSEPPEPAGPSPARRWLWRGALFALAALLWMLFKAFPGAVSTPEDWGWVARGAVLMVLVSTALLAPGRIDWGEKARHAGIWLGILVVLVLGVTYRSELGGVVQRVRMQFSSSYPVTTAPHELVVTQGDEGGFYVMGKVNGERVRFLVDTGASDTVLSPADARRLGVDLTALSFDRPSETANGTGYGARFQADRVSIGDIAFDDVPVIINQAPMSSSLLGMTFLRRLESFQVRGDKLYLKSSG